MTRHSRANAREAAPGNTRLIVFHTTCCFHDNIQLNASAGLLAAYEGAIVHHLLIDAAACSYIMRLPEPKLSQCELHRVQTQIELLDLGLEEHIVYLEDHLEQVLETADARWDALQKGRVSWTGVRLLDRPLWGILKSTMARYHQWQSLPPGPDALTVDEENTWRRFARKAFHYVLALARVFDQLRPTHLLVFNGLYYQERIASELAWAQGIKVSAMESSAFKNRLYFFPFGSVSGIKSGFREQISHLAASDAIPPPNNEIALQEFLAESHSGRNAWSKQPAPHVGQVIDSSLEGAEVKQERKHKILFLGQIPFDSVLSEAEPYIPVNAALREVMRILAGRAGWELIIRLHPGATTALAGGDLLGEHLRRDGLPENVTLVTGRQANTYQLMAEADVGITISSQTGLEMLAMHKPVVILGSPFYSGLGISFDVPSLSGLEIAVQQAVQFLVTPAWKAKVDRVVDHWINSYLVSIDPEKVRVTERDSARLVSLLTRSAE